MSILTVLYPKSEHSQFDHRYYLEKHIPLVKSSWTQHGLHRVELFRGVAAPGGGAPGFEMIANLHFATSDQIGGVLQAHAAEVIADLANFTNIQPALQISDAVSF